MLVNILVGKLSAKPGDTPNVTLNYSKKSGFSSSIDTVKRIHCGKNNAENYPVYIEYTSDLGGF